ATLDPQRAFGFTRDLSVTIKPHGNPDVVVRVTSDGTDPTNRSEVVNGALRLTRTTVLKARAFVGDTAHGPIRRAAYERLDDVGAVATGVKRRGDPAERVRAPVRPGGLLVLVVHDANDGIEGDQADWAEAAFECGSGRVLLSEAQPTWARQGWGEMSRDRN